MFLKLVLLFSSQFKLLTNYLYCFYVKTVYGSRFNKFQSVRFERNIYLDITSKQCSIILKKGIVFRSNAVIRVRENAILNIGSRVFFNCSVSINCRKKITIGDNCMFGESVKLYDHNHKFRKKEQPIIDQGFSYGFIEIGDNCWIGSNVVILKNVVIGSNVIIGANCMISKSIPSNSIVRLADNAITIQSF